VRSSYDHDGAWCVEHDLLADRAEQQTFEATAPARTHHNEVVVRRVLENDRDRSSDLDDRLNLDPFEIASDGRERAVHEVTRVALERFWIHHRPGRPRTCDGNGEGVHDSERNLTKPRLGRRELQCVHRLIGTVDADYHGTQIVSHIFIVGMRRNRCSPGLTRV